MKLYFRILSFASPVAKYVIPYFFCVLLYSVFNSFSYVMIAPLLDTLFSNGPIERVTAAPEFSFSVDYLQALLKYNIFKYYGEGTVNIQQILVILSIILSSSMLVCNIFRFGAQKITENFRIKTLRNIRNALFKNVMNLNVRYFTNEKKGDILSKLTTDIAVVQYTVSGTLQVAFKEPMLIATYFVVLLAISVKLTMFTLVFMPIAALIIGTIVKRLRYYALDSQGALGNMLGMADEALSAMKVVKSYNITDYITSLFYKENERYSSIQRRMATRQQMASPMSEFLGVSAVAVILTYGGGLVMQGDLDASQFLAYVAIFSQITRPARALADAFSTIHQGLAAGERVMELIDKKPEVVDTDTSLTLGSFKDKIEFKNVVFSYNEDKKVIDGINLTINKGETVAFVGSSGGGKSTLADLVSRFYDVNSGSIEIDGHDIREYSLSSLRNCVGTVSQDVVLFNDTIYNNIQLGRLGATKEEIIDSTKIANAYDFVMNTEKGFDTNIGDRGAKLSGGQRQRLSIARAVLKNPDILILDEATSALDTESEKLVQEALNSLLKDRTSIVIAHRLSTIQNADKIAVIDHGKIVELGTHSELISMGGYYKKLIDMQKV